MALGSNKVKQSYLNMRNWNLSFFGACFHVPCDAGFLISCTYINSLKLTHCTLQQTMEVTACVYIKVSYVHFMFPKWSSNMDSQSQSKFSEIFFHWSRGHLVL